MKESAGIIIRLNNNKILLCKPATRPKNIDKWKKLPIEKVWGPPKGGIDIGESPVDAAIRETREEIGISIDKKLISNINSPIIINYNNGKNDDVYKRVFLYTVDINAVTKIGMSTETIPIEFLQIEEIESAHFMNKSEAKQKIFHRFSSILDMI